MFVVSPILQLALDKLFILTAMPQLITLSANGQSRLMYSVVCVLACVRACVRAC
jgi:hypothetical protein